MAADWHITTGLGYGQATWAEVKRDDGAYVIVDMETMAIMENGLVDEHGVTVSVPSDVADQLIAMADDI